MGCHFYWNDDYAPVQVSVGVFICVGESLCAGAAFFSFQNFFSKSQKSNLSWLTKGFTDEV